MPKLKLSTTTLVAVETRENQLMRLAIKDCVDKVDFAEVLILTNKPDEYCDLGCVPRFHIVEDWPNKLGWSRSWWYDVPPLLRTAHTLNCQWDAGIWSVDMWTDRFLSYDFCGAPWMHHAPTGPRVGNGGFSLVSTRLKRYIADRRAQFPCDSDIDDALLCIKYRPALEAAGFVWAPEKVAYDFSFEGCDGSKPTKHFGFHALYNFPKVLDRDRLFERMELVMRSPYIAKPDSYMMKAFTEMNPEVTREIMAQGAAE